MSVGSVALYNSRVTETSTGGAPRHVSALRAFRANPDQVAATKALASELPLHFPARRLDRAAPTKELMTREEQRPKGYLTLWPYLYRFYGADQRPLYLGISSCSPTRLDGHRRQADWWPLAEYIAISAYPTDAAVKEAERAAIRAEWPRFNKQLVRGPATVKVPLHGEPAEAAALLFREAMPEFLAELTELLGQPGRFPQPTPPPSAFGDQEAS